MRASDTVSTSYRKIGSIRPWPLVREPPRTAGACSGREVREICIPGADQSRAIRELSGDGTTAVSTWPTTWATGLPPGK